MSHLEEIKLKLSIEEVVGGYLQLQKAGRNLKGLCPFHSDSRPSLMVSPEKGIAYCFSCNTGGDIFKFTQLMEKVEFAEALRLLAGRANVRLPEYNPKIQDARQKTLELNQLAVEFFQNQLKQHPSHQEYFLNRGLKPETLQYFQLGYSPDSYQALKNHLLGQGYKETDLVEAGLTNQRSIADKTSYDRFRNRLIFPLFNAQDQPVGFAGRVIDAGEPKYLNSPDTPVYHKSAVLYGLNWAKEAIKQENLAIVVEGYMDVIAAHQAGTRNTVASSGTAITEQQIKLLERYSKNIAFCMDSDEAGQKAMDRGNQILQLINEIERRNKLKRGVSEGDLMEIKIIQLPQGKDPDECIQKDPAAWKKAIENRLPVMDFYFHHAFKQNEAKTLEGKKAIAQALLPLIKALQSTLEQGHYVEELAKKLNTPANWLWHDLQNLPFQKRTPAPPSSPEKAPKKNPEMDRETLLIGFLGHTPQTYPIVHEQLIESLGLNRELEKFYKAFKNVYNHLSTVDKPSVQAQLGEEDAQKLEIYSLLIESTYPDFSEEATLKEVHRLIREINQNNLKTLQNHYIGQLKATQDPEEKKRLLQKCDQLSTLKHSL